MFTEKDFEQMASLGISPETAEKQVERFKTGFPWMEIVAPATPERGITVLEEEEEQAALEYYESEATAQGKCKFVPASGAASRMFKDLFAGLDKPNASSEKFCSNIEKFAFFDPTVFDSKEPVAILTKTLTGEGLGYGSKPKGVLKFHKYPSGETRTAFAEHLVEAQDYMRSEEDVASLTVTVSPEHQELFDKALSEVKDKYEARYGVRYNVRFTYQDKSTDTIAVDAEGNPFRKADGSLLFRPAGHGALIHNLNAIEEELVSIKNIDNVAKEDMLPTTSKWKKILLGKALELRDTLQGFLMELDAVTCDNIRYYDVYPLLPGYNAPKEDLTATPECQMLCNDIEEYLYENLCIEIPQADDCKGRVAAIRKILDRPIRVCGMVRNEGEPGGGPFIIREKDGSTSLQILESVQINPDDPIAMEALSKATHFNPVDLVCCLHNYRGEKYNLPDYVDDEAGFISSKSYEGRELKALELPGLWNGAMSKWNTLFVEVPLETFNPVKTAVDLLRPAHQA